jgi:SAM-dependent methyltransferase
MIKTIKTAISPFRKLIYNLTGRKPWSYGYVDVRWDLIGTSLNNQKLLSSFKSKQIPHQFGIGMDERVAEYPWIISRLSDNNNTQLLDAGSTFNFKELVNQPKVASKQLTIFTFYPEPNQFISKRVSYNFGDLRNMPYRDGQFDEVVCQSTIEHVDMDNSIYGYSIAKNENEQQKSYEYLKVVDELLRVLKPGGALLLTFPYGKFEHHGFFQQFDEEMVARILEKLNGSGNTETDYLHYTTNGWIFDTKENCAQSNSYNPHTGKGKGTDGAAHCRCVCCIAFKKNST